MLAHLIRQKEETMRQRRIPWQVEEADGRLPADVRERCEKLLAQLLREVVDHQHTAERSESNEREDPTDAS